MECNETSIPELVTKCDWWVKIRSMQNEDLEKICVGPDITWWRLNILVREWIWFPSTESISSDHHEYDLILK